eukprot:gnl/MRDRNA2_/MRDRNA2_98107_c0_seq1.p1 gnl/MRDRNA2_/MRDRNA2_98107_c0~~gnl/MRDRNA2_/MRDRNA2_98107_c0_seq1.p1  ORF type:complete len:239 (+),score=25.53 gnl/MRDRNA2_/MRDRNA2_98107_c0_seq1:73-789(+)
MPVTVQYIDPQQSKPQMPVTVQHTVNFDPTDALLKLCEGVKEHLHWFPSSAVAEIYLHCNLRYAIRKSCETAQRDEELQHGPASLRIHLVGEKKSRQSQGGRKRKSKRDKRAAAQENQNVRDGEQSCTDSTAYWIEDQPFQVKNTFINLDCIGDQEDRPKRSQSCDARIPSTGSGSSLDQYVTTSESRRNSHSGTASSADDSVSEIWGKSKSSSGNKSWADLSEDNVQHHEAHGSCGS